MPKYIVRYGVMRTLGVFGAGQGDELRRGTQIVARTERGLELGEVLCEATDEAVAQLDNPRRGQVLRTVSADDEAQWSRICSNGRNRFDICRRMFAEMGLEMKLVDVEQLFGGERIVVYYISENRIDFRELVKRLASEFQTRIEMRQIGVRDEAKLLADYGDCGKPVCCNTHLSQMPPVSMKMAKLQKATLDPTKISGRCGRLKCCLRYEYDTYEALQKDLPPVGSHIRCDKGQGRVLAHEILAGQLLVEMEDRRRILIPTSEVEAVLSAQAVAQQKSRAAQAGDDSSGERSGAGGGGAERSNSGERTGNRERGGRDRGGRERGGGHRRSGPADSGSSTDSGSAGNNPNPGDSSGPSNPDSPSNPGPTE